MSGSLRDALEKLCADWTERSTGYAEYRELRALLAAHPAGHDLVISLGDCELYGECTCGKPLGSIKPDKSLNVLGLAWERHVMTEVPR